jgi:hypothetical protein
MKKFIVQWENQELETSGECVIFGNNEEEVETAFYKQMLNCNILYIGEYNE